jgi:hypothetical protein
MAEKLKHIYEGASGMRAIISVFFFVAGGFALYYGMEASIVKAQTEINSNSALVTKLVGVVQTQNDRQISTERNQAVMEYRLTQDQALNERQSQQLSHQTKIIERIAAKLNVRTED